MRAQPTATGTLGGGGSLRLGSTNIIENSNSETTITLNANQRTTLSGDLAVVGGEGVVKLIVRDKKNDTSNDFSIVVGETDATFSLNFKVENIKILPGTYDVVMSKKLLSRFVSKDYNLKYYIALEPDSTFE